MDGFLCIHKPQGPSSFQIIDQLRRILRIKKAGHAGTLDPKASGLLLIALGAATRLLQYLPTEPKVYQFGIKFGEQTDTLDSEGKVIFSGGAIPERSAIETILEKFRGVILQVPPVFSAIKIDGVRAYKLARQGDAPEIQERPITIYSLKLNEFDAGAGEAHCEVCCSGGTYVRSLARDIAKEAGTYGFASYVHRTQIGPFRLDDAVKSELFDQAQEYIIPMGKFFADHSVLVTENQKIDIVNGKKCMVAESTADTMFAFYNNELFAVLKRVEGSEFRPVTVLNVESR